MKVLSFVKLGQPSMLRDLLIAFLVLGVVIGGIFPWFAKLFVTPKSGMETGFIVSCLMAGLVLGAVNYMVVSRVLLRRLARLAEVADAIGNRDVSHRCSLESNDLIGTIISSVNRMAENLRVTMTGISDSAELIGESTQRLKGVTDETDRCMRSQSQDTDQVAIAMNQMVATIQEVTRNAEQAAQAAEEAHGSASNGALVATEALGGMEALTGKVNEVGERIEGLQADSDNIGVVLDVIRGIAEQTNLLALNAAIEAARAGEQGRGFAVVADEVRTLASRTQQSTAEIQQMIERLQSKAGSAVKATVEARQKADSGMEQVEKAAEALAEIAAAVATMNSMNSQIAHAVDQQNSVAEEINGNIASISESCEQTVAGAQQAASATEQLAGLAGGLQDTMRDFRLT